MIALDTEFIRESTFYPVIALIQIATDEESWLIDPMALKQEELKPLLDVLTSPDTIKILHAAQADQECFYTSYGMVAKPTFDTAVGASLSGHGESVGLSKLVREVLGVSLAKGHARTDWTERPIQDHLARYAHLDVQYLIPLARKLLAEIDARKRRQWAFELTARFENTRLYEPNPDGIALKLAKTGKTDRRGYAILRELAAWREQRVRSLDIPRRRVADDDVLMALSNARPKDMAHLSAFRGLNRGELKHSGDAILEAIRKGMRVPDRELPELPKSDIPDPREARALELLHCFVKVLADDLAIAPRHLAVVDDLLPLLRRDFRGKEDLVNAGVLTAGAAELIGEELLAMVRGSRGLSLSRSNVKIAKL
jgi:ribonuclease D